MSATYTVCEQGYQCPDLRLSLKAAREEARRVVEDRLAQARRRGHKTAKLHKLSEDAFRITMGAHKNSTLYSHVLVIQN